MSFDLFSLVNHFIIVMSQSLSSRAMSFDEGLESYATEWKKVSIPFEQGDVFRQMEESGITSEVICLNPFRAGRCLSTITISDR